MQQCHRTRNINIMDREKLTKRVHGQKKKVQLFLCTDKHKSMCARTGVQINTGTMYYY